MQRSFASLIVGVVLGVVAIVLMVYYLQSRPQAPTQSLGTIVVAGADFVPGAPIAANSLKLAEWPTQSIPEGAFSNIPEIFKGATQPEDRIALKVLKTGEPVLRTNVSGFGGRATLSREVSRGMRAVSISVSDVSGVAGFILPGDHVDVMLTRQVEAGGNDNLATDVILQNVTVLGIDQLSDQERDKPTVARTVTVEVTTEQAQKLTLAQAAGSLSLALRNAETLDQTPTARINVPDLYGEAPRPPQQPVVHHAASSGIHIRYGDAEPVNSATP